MKKDLKEIQILKKLKNTQRAVSTAPLSTSRKTRNKIASNFTANHMKFERILEGRVTPQPQTNDVSILSSEFMQRRKKSQKLTEFQSSTSQCTKSFISGNFIADIVVKNLKNRASFSSSRYEE